MTSYAKSTPSSLFPILSGGDDQLQSNREQENAEDEDEESLEKQQITDTVNMTAIPGFGHFGGKRKWTEDTKDDMLSSKLTSSKVVHPDKLYESSVGQFAKFRMHSLIRCFSFFGSQEEHISPSETF